MVADDEDVLRARLRDVAVDVEHERLIGAVLVRLDLGHDVVQIVEGLDRWAQALRRHAAIRRGHDLEAALVDAAEEVDARLRDYDDARPGLGLPRVEAQVPGPAGDDRANVPFPHVVPAAGVEDDLRQRLLGMRDLEVDRLRAVEEPLQVPLELEDPAVVGPDAFEDAVPVQEAVVEHADLRLGLRVELAVDVDTQFQSGGPRPRISSPSLIDFLPWESGPVVSGTFVRSSARTTRRRGRSLPSSRRRAAAGCRAPVSPRPARPSTPDGNRSCGSIAARTPCSARPAVRGCTP